MSIQEAAAIVGLLLSGTVLLGFLIAVIYYFWKQKDKEDLKDDLARARDRGDDWKKRYEEKEVECNENVSRNDARIAQLELDVSKAERRLAECEKREDNLRKGDLRLKGERGAE